MGIPYFMMTIEDEFWRPPKCWKGKRAFIFMWSSFNYL